MADEAVESIEAEEPEAQKRHWSIWLARTTLALGALSILLALVGAFGSGQGWWTFIDGFGMLTLALGIAAIALLIGGVTLFYYRRMGKRIFLVNLAGLVLAVGYIGYIGYHVVVARTLPQIHDITTDLSNPPKFQTLTLRPDNLKDVPGRGASEYLGLNARERWQMLHEKAYGDITSLVLDAPVADVAATARQLIVERGWEMAAFEPATGRVEATDTVSLFRFKDDIVLRISPVGGENRSVVDMRSVSRVGRSDLGVNAKRVRAFLADLETAVNARNP